MLKRQNTGPAQSYYSSDSFYDREKRGHILRALVFIILFVLVCQAAYIVTYREELYTKYLISRVTDPVTTLKKYAIYIYSETNCENCRTLTEELRKNGILYREFYVDTDQPRRSEMMQYFKYKYPQEQRVALPLIRVNKEIVMGKISLRELAAYAQKP